MRKFLSVVLVTSGGVSPAAAFAPLRPATQRVVKPLSALLPEHVDALSTAANHMQHVITTSSHLLADAAEATAEVATEEGGWWQSYLNIFENSIRLVHSTISPPLRSVGITETWGISIAVFTAGEILLLHIRFRLFVCICVLIKPTFTLNLAVRTLLLPLSVQQSKSTEYMKALKPYMNEIKEKFPNNEDMRNRVTAKLFEDAQQNPLAGCLVSLAQLPIFLGLYRGVRLLAIDGQLNEPFLWIPSLEGPVGPPDYRGLEWLTEGWTNVDGLPTPSMGWETTLAFLVMPVILVLGQKLTMDVLQPADMQDESTMSAEEKENADRTKTIFKFLPLMIGFFSLQVPAGLTIYWFTSNIYTLTQSLAVRQYYAANPPEINLPEYWDKIDNLDEMSAEDQRKAAEAGLRSGPTFQDLQDGTLSFGGGCPSVLMYASVHEPISLFITSCSCLKNRVQVSLCRATGSTSCRERGLEARGTGFVQDSH